MGESGTRDESSRAEEIARLLAVGLDAYGMGEVSEAMIAWREALRLDPGNREARDYIHAADRRQSPDPARAADADDTTAELVREARQVLHQGDLEAAHDLFQTAAEQAPTSLEIQAYLDMLRSRLFKLYRARVGDLDAVPNLRVETREITRYNLPKDAGFVLSLVDGRTPLSDVISLSGMDAFGALRLVHGLIDARILEMRA